MKPDESNIGIVLGLICVITTLTMWIPMDLWLRAHGHEFITTELREALKAAGGWALVIVGVIGAVLAIAFYHFFYVTSVQ